MVHLISRKKKLNTEMNKLETNLITFMPIFIKYFYIKFTFQFKSDKCNYLIFNC